MFCWKSIENFLLFWCCRHFCYHPNHCDCCYRCIANENIKNKINVYKIIQHSVSNTCICNWFVHNVCFEHRSRTSMPFNSIQFASNHHHTNYNKIESIDRFKWLLWGSWNIDKPIVNSTWLTLIVIMHPLSVTMLHNIWYELTSSVSACDMWLRYNWIRK